MESSNTPRSPNKVPAKTTFPTHRYTTAVRSRCHPVNTAVSPLLRFATLNSASPYLYRNVDSPQFRKWLYIQVVELHQLPKALGKLPPHARRDSVLTDFLILKIETGRIEETIDGVIGLYHSLVGERESGLEAETGESDSQCEVGEAKIEDIDGKQSS